MKALRKFLDKKKTIEDIQNLAHGWEAELYHITFDKDVSFKFVSVVVSEITNKLNDDLRIKNG
jgi:hypothetical protein